MTKPATRTPDHIGHLHLRCTDDQDHPADASIYLGVPAVASLSVLCIDIDHGSAHVAVDSGYGAVFTLRLGEPSVRVLPGVDLRLLAVTQRRRRWVTLEISAPARLPIWRGAIYPRVLAAHRAQLAAA